MGLTSRAVPIAYFSMTAGTEWGVAGHLTIRTALAPLSLVGAVRGDVLRLILAHGAKLTAAGIAAGILAAYGLTRLIASQLFGVKPTDSVTFVSVAAILAFVAIVACWIPARRAMRIVPMLALREE